MRLARCDLPDATRAARPSYGAQLAAATAAGAPRLRSSRVFLEISEIPDEQTLFDSRFRMARSDKFVRMAKPQVRNPVGRVIHGIRSRFRWSRGAVGLAARLTRIETTAKVPTALRLLTREDSAPIRHRLCLDMAEIEEVLDGRRSVESAVEASLARLAERGEVPDRP